MRMIRSNLDDISKAADKQIATLFEQRLQADRAALQLELQGLEAARGSEQVKANSSAAISSAQAALAPLQQREQRLKALLLLLRDKVCPSHQMVKLTTKGYDHQTPIHTSSEVFPSHQLVLPWCCDSLSQCC